MKRKFTAKTAPLILTLAVTLSACTPAASPPSVNPPITNTPAAGSSAVNLPAEGALTISQVTDYLIQAADNYNGETDRTVLMKGMAGEENEKATRIQTLVLLSRVFGELPEPTGNNKRIAAPAPDLSGVSEWAKPDLENLARGGILLLSDFREVPESASEEAFTDEVDSAEIKKLAARVWALLSSNLKDDFYNTVNKNDLNAAVIPAGQTQGGGSVEMQELVNSRVHEIVAEIVSSGKTYAEGSDEQKVKSFYNNFMNAEQRNKEGIKPLNKYFEAIDGANTVKELNEVSARIVNELGKYNSGLINFYLSVDLKDNTRKTVTLLAPYGNLTIEEYQDPNNENHQKYQTFLIGLLSCAGETKEQAETLVNQIFGMEEALNTVIETLDFSDANTHYNYLTAEELEKQLPGLGMPEFFAAVGVKPSTGYSLESIDIMKVYAKYLNNEHLPMLKAMFKLNLMSANNEFLGDELSNYYQEYYASIGSVPSEKKPLDEQASEYIGSYLSEILAKLYVQRYFPAEAKAEAESLAAELVQAFRERVKKLDWLNENTRKEALRKLDNLKILVGYSDDWGESAEITDQADGGSFFENMASVGRLRLKEEMAGQEESKAETDFSSMSPLTVNAASNRVTNTILMPAGTLIAPLFDINASKEENLSGIGMIIAHEITHVFDDQGAQYDADGNLRDWWTKEDYDHFQSQVKKAESFYNGYEIAPGAAVNGNASLSENISDTGGLACALEVLSKEENPDYDLFFRNYAKSWVRVAERKLTEGLGESDHAPVKARVNRVIVNFQEFYDTYNIQPEDGMYVAPEDRIKIW